MITSLTIFDRLMYFANTLSSNGTLENKNSSRGSDSLIGDNNSLLFSDFASAELNYLEAKSSYCWLHDTFRLKNKSLPFRKIIFVVLNWTSKS